MDWNTTTTDYSASPLTVTIGGISATIHAAPNTESVAVTGLSVSISSFGVTITGNFGFEENSGGIEAAANQVTALLSAGPASVGVTGGTLALLLNNDGTKVLEASGALPVQRGGFLPARAARRGVLVDWSTAATDYSAAPLTVAISGVERDDPRLGAEHAERGGDGVERVNFEFRDDHGQFPGSRRTRAGSRRRRTR